jgi:DNA-binding NarL/FixJ family response regulator
MKKITVAIADDHPIVISGLKSLLSLQPEIEIVGDVVDIDLLFELIEKHKPDILLLDISFNEKSSLDYIKEIKNKSPKTKILILTMHEELSLLREALSKGASGFLSKRSIYEDLLYAVKSIINGGTYIHPLMAEKLAHTVYDGGSNDISLSKDPEQVLWALLSRREQEVLIGVAKGLSNKEIGLQYDLSEKTVATYRLRGLAKLKISNKTDLLDLCLKLGYIK